MKKIKNIPLMPSKDDMTISLDVFLYTSDVSTFSPKT